MEEKSNLLINFENKLKLCNACMHSLESLAESFINFSKTVTLTQT